MNGPFILQSRIIWYMLPRALLPLVYTRISTSQLPEMFAAAAAVVMKRDVSYRCQLLFGSSLLGCNQGENAPPLSFCLFEDEIQIWTKGSSTARR